MLEEVQPRVILHTQALSDVDRCEREPQVAQRLNVDTTATLVEALDHHQRRKGQGPPPWLISVSTDYVFAGTKGAAYDETDVPDPISEYGRSKWRGEQAALRYPRAVVARTSTLFGPGRMNFCDHIVERLRAGQSVEAFIDQVTSPTLTTDLAAALGALSAALESWPPRGESWPRVVHLSNAGWCTRLSFAQRVAALIGGNPDLIRPIRMADQHRDAPRPPQVGLATKHVPQLIGRMLRSWQDALDAYLRQRPS